MLQSVFGAKPGAAGHADEATPPRDICEGAREEEAEQFAAGRPMAHPRSAGLWSADADADHRRTPAQSGQEALISLFSV